MKKIIKISIFLTVFCLIISSFMLCTSAAKSAVIHFNKDTVDVGDTVTVTVSVNPGIEMSAVSFDLEYDDSVLKYKSGTGVGSAGVINVRESPSGTKSVKYSFKFTALIPGTAVISVSDCIYYKISDSVQTDEDAVKMSGASAKLTVKDPSLSSNAKLKSLTVSGYKLSPAFSSGRTKYTVKVPYDVEKISVSAKTDDSNAKVKSVTGNSKLKVGKNTVTVLVEAQNGSNKEYIITVTRMEKDESLSSEMATDDNEDISPLSITLEDKLFTIEKELDGVKLFEGFTVEAYNLKGNDIETAVDKDHNYRIFYLKSAETGKVAPYLYNENLDLFEQLKYTIYNKKYYIFAKIPADYSFPESVYPSSVTIDGFTVESMTYSSAEMSDFHYIYCFSNGEFNLYRYDNAESTLQRYPDLKAGVITSQANSKNGSLLSRFLGLSTNGKFIIVAIAVIVLGVLALLALLVAYFIKKANNLPEDDFFDVYGEEFDSVEIKK